MFHKTETLVWQDRFTMLVWQGISASFSQNWFENGQDVRVVLPRYKKPRVIQGGELLQYSHSTFLPLHWAGTEEINHLPKAYRPKISYEEKKYAPSTQAIGRETAVPWTRDYEILFNTKTRAIFYVVQSLLRIKILNTQQDPLVSELFFLNEWWQSLKLSFFKKLLLKHILILNN